MLLGEFWAVSQSKGAVKRYSIGHRNKGGRKFLKSGKWGLAQKPVFETCCPWELLIGKHVFEDGSFSFAVSLPTSLHIWAIHHAGQRVSFTSKLEAWWVKNKLEAILVGIQVAYVVLSSWRRCRSLFLLWILSVIVDGLPSAARQRFATSTHF